MELNLALSTLIIILIVTGASTWLLAAAYRDTKFVLKHKISQQKGELIGKEVSKKLSTDKNLTKREKDDRVLTEKNDVSEYESMTFSIFYTNVLFLTGVVVLSSFIVGPLSANPNTNYAISVLSSAGLASLLSTQS